MGDTPVYHYCTLFDRNYLLKGLALYRSLERHGGEFVLHILCMDDTVHELITRMGFDKVRLIRRVDFEDPQLLAVKPTRTVAEYCWTCTPSLPLYVFDQNPDVDLITYLDADLFFFSTPEPIFEEFGDASILIVEHRFAPCFASSIVNGRYNVEWLTFRRDANGLAALRWWREKCIEWCFYRLEEDRMGDQKYLDDWPTRFAGMHILQHLGAGVAPWNVSQYIVTERDGQIWVDHRPLIFYHFHQFQMFRGKRYVWASRGYSGETGLPQIVYERYICELEAAVERVRSIDPRFSHGIVKPEKLPLRKMARRFLPPSVRIALGRLGF